MRRDAYLDSVRVDNVLLLLEGHTRGVRLVHFVTEAARVETEHLGALGYEFWHDADLEVLV